MSQHIATPPQLRQTKTNLPSPLRKMLHRSSETTPELPTSRVPAIQPLTFEPFAIPKQKGLVWGIATPTETPLKCIGQIVDTVDKPLPGLPATRPLVRAKRVSVPKVNDVSHRVLPRAKSELHLERTTRANSHQSLPELSTIIEDDRPSIVSSNTAPVVTRQQVYPSSFDEEAVQADLLAFMPILVPTKAPLRGWSPEDLDCPEMTSSNSSLASSRTTSVVTTPLPKWEAESAYPFPLIKIADDSDGHAIKDDELFLSNALPMENAQFYSEAKKADARYPLPTTENVSSQLDNGQSHCLEFDKKNRSYSKVSQTAPKPSEPAKVSSTPATLSQGSKKPSGARIPVPKLPDSRGVAQPTNVVNSKRPPTHGSTSLVQNGGLVGKKNDPIAGDLFKYTDPKSNATNYEKGRLEAEKIAKEFWSKHKATESGKAEKPPVKVMLESLFYTAPADLQPCPERLRFLGIRR